MTENLSNQSQLLVVDQDKLIHEKSQYLTQVSEQWVSVLGGINPDDFRLIKRVENQLNTIGEKVLQDFYQLSDDMNEPLERQMSDNSATSHVLKLFKKIQNQLDAFRLPQAKPSLFEKFMLLFSLRDNPWHVWFDKYNQLKPQLISHIDQLQKLARRVKAENILLITHHKKLHDCNQQLENLIDLFTHVISKTNKQINENVILDVLLKRKLTLQESLLVIRQQLLSSELFINKNKALSIEVVNTSKNASSVLDSTAQIVVLKNLANKGHKPYTNKHGLTDQRSNEEISKVNNLINRMVNDLSQTN